MNYNRGYESNLCFYLILIFISSTNSFRLIGILQDTVTTESFATDLSLIINENIELRDNHVYSKKCVIISIDIDEFEDVLIMRLNEIQTLSYVLFNKIDVDESLFELIQDFEVTLYVVVMKELTYEYVDDITTLLTRSNTWKPRTKTFFVLSKRCMLNVTQIKSLFRQLWSYKMLNTVLIHWDAGIRIHAYNPFVYDFSLELPRSTWRNLFRSKTGNMHGYDIRVSLFSDNVRMYYSHADDKPKFAGVDGEAMQAIFQHIKANILNVTSTDEETVGNVFSNKSGSGSTGDLISGYADAALNSRILRTSFYGLIETTYPWERDDLCFMVPKSQLEPLINNVINIISPIIFLILIGNFVFLVVFATCLRIKERELGVYKDEQRYGAIVMDLIKCFLGQSVVMRFSGSAWMILIISIELYALVTNTAIQAILTGSLTYPSYQEDANKIDDVINSNLTLVMERRHYDMLEKNLDPQLLQKTQGRVQIVNKREIVRMVEGKTQEYAFLIKQSNSRLYSRLKRNYVHGRPFYHTMSECPIPCLVAYAVTYGSPYIVPIDRGVRDLTESGLRNYWDGMSQFLLFVNGIKTVYTSHCAQSPNMSFDNFKVVIWVWMTGVGISLFVFLCELLQGGVTCLAKCKIFKNIHSISKQSK